jgi:hypothetical protein
LALDLTAGIPLAIVEAGILSTVLAAALPMRPRVVVPLTCVCVGVLSLTAVYISITLMHDTQALPEPIPAPAPAPAPAPDPAPQTPQPPPSSPQPTITTFPPSQPPALPEFPWPPPQASASYVLPTPLLERHRTIASAVDAVLSALERNGYVEHSLYTAGPRAAGVALVTRLERINEDGTSQSAANRWSTRAERALELNLVAFLRGLFFVDPGRYRLIVFVFSDVPFSQSARQVSEGEARIWLRSGGNILPPEIAAQAFNGHCTALIYEFASDDRGVRRVDSPLTGKQHLEKAGVLALLAKAN